MNAKRLTLLNAVSLVALRRCAPAMTLAPTLLAAGLMGIQPSDALAGPIGYTFTPIAFLGDPAPGGGAFNNDFEPSALNNRGEFAFTADLMQPGQEGVFLAHGDALTQLVRFGQSAPGGGVFSASELGNLGLNDAGDVALAFTLEPFQFSPFINGGIYRYSHLTQTLTPVVIPGTPAPGGGYFLGVSFDVSLNKEGALAFSGFVGSSVSPVQGAFVAGKKGGITTVASLGTPGPNGDTFDAAYDPRLNNGGDVVFNGHLSTAGVDAFSVYVKNAATGKISNIATAGHSAPGGGVLVNTEWPRINSAGDVAFAGILIPGTDTSPNIVGIYLHTGKTLLRIAGPSDPMPGGGHVTIIPDIVNSQVGLNNRGEVAFFSALDTTDVLPTGDEGLYVYSGGSTHLIARSGTVIPGVGTIYSLEMGNGEAQFLPPAPSGIPTCGAQLNDRGQTLFGCSLTDGRVVLLLATPSEDGNQEHEADQAGD